jgi:hypothetical protein
MSATLINLIIQLIAGAIGGHAVAAGMKDADLGTAGNTIAGALGGLGAGQLLATVIPVFAGAAGGGVDITSIIGQLLGGLVGGAILTAVLGLIKNAIASR